MSIDDEPWKKWKKKFVSFCSIEVFLFVYFHTVAFGKLYRAVLLLPPEFKLMIREIELILYRNSIC